LLALIAVALLGLGGPGRGNAAESEAPAATVDATPAAVTSEGPPPTATPEAAEAPDTDGPPTGGPEQDTSAESDASVSNDAAVDQSSDQAQDAGDTSGTPAATEAGAAQSGQEAQTAQLVQADAAASSTDAGNETESTRVGAGSAGDRGAVEQSSSADASAAATATQATGQQGAETSGSTGQQSAAASANARATDSTNSLLDARIGAPGDDAGFDQSVRAGAAARAELEGPDGVQQQSHAAANAQVGDARNSAVELRLASDGDSAGGRQSIAADATAAAPDATASAAIENPFNTFVSLRVNSNGTTGPVLQDVSERESETVNGSVSERRSEDAGDRTWDFDSNGVVIHFTSDGANTDLRIAVDNPALHRPDQAPLFVWQWDMVFGPGSQPDCAITSAADTDRVSWSFDCDPDDRIQRSAGDSPASAPPANALSWAWSWLRPQLAAWSWARNDTFFLPACGPTCALLLDFRWLSLEPVEASVDQTSEDTTADANVEAAVEQTNEVAASATASAASAIEQILLQSGGDQAALQQALVAQLVTAQAAAELTNVANVSVGIGARVSQANQATSDVSAAVGAKVIQMLSQQQSGADAIQTQVALQSALTTQEIHAGAVATVSQASNRDVSVGGTAVQRATSSASVTGVELASTRQVAEQEQQGDGSDQVQLVGQWADTAQQLELLAGAGISEARISSTLNGDSATLNIDAAAVSTGTAKSTIQQLTLQLQRGDDVAQQQESYQTASVAQSGTALAAVSAGGTLRYVLVPVPVSTQAIEPAALPLFEQVATPTPIEPSFVPARAHGLPASRTKAKAATAFRPLVTPFRPASVSEQAAAAAAAAPLAVHVLHDSASKAGVAGPAPKRAKDAEEAPDRSPRDQCLAPCSGASAASAGTGSGSAFVAPSGYALTPVSRLGRRQSAPAGRRPAAVVLLRAKPG
jgi:hypothetical protein